MKMGKVGVVGAKTSLFCTRVEWALKLKGVDYEYIEEDIINKSPLLLKLNPVYKKVPVLVHDDNPIPESLVILEYIDEMWKERPLLPQDPYQRAYARFWAKFADEKCIFGAFEACWTEGERKEKALKTALEHLQFLEKEIQGKEFFGGEQIGYLDLVIGWIGLWLGVMEQVGEMKLLEPNKFPYLHEWSQHFILIPVIKQCLPPREILVDYFNASINYVRSLNANKA